MLQFNVELCRIASNVVHKVRRYIHLFVASEFACPVEFYFTGVSDVGRSSSPTLRGLFLRELM